MTQPLNLEALRRRALIKAKALADQAETQRIHDAIRQGRVDYYARRGETPPIHRKKAA